MIQVAIISVESVLYGKPYADAVNQAQGIGVKAPEEALEPEEELEAEPEEELPDYEADIEEEPEENPEEDFDLEELERSFFEE